MNSEEDTKSNRLQENNNSPSANRDVASVHISCRSRITPKSKSDPSLPYISYTNQMPCNESCALHGLKKKITFTSADNPLKNIPGPSVVKENISRVTNGTSKSGNSVMVQMHQSNSSDTHHLSVDHRSSESKQRSDLSTGLAMQRSHDIRRLPTSKKSISVKSTTEPSSSIASTGRCLKAKSSTSLPLGVSSSSMGPGTCRICMTCGHERLISPCYCKGSLGLIHVSCLERWLSVSGRCSCELCGFNFPVLLTQRYSLYRAIIIWFSYSRNRVTFQTDCLFFWMLSILTTSLVACCALGSKYFIEQGGVAGLPRALAEALADVMILVVLCGYAVTTYALWRDHATIWRRWRTATMDVRLVLENLVT